MTHESITGIVTRCSQPKPNTFGVQLDTLPNIWLNGFGENPCEVGTEVELGYVSVEKEGKTFHNIKSIRKCEKQETLKEAAAVSEGGGTRPPERDVQIARAVALKAAIETAAAPDGSEEKHLASAESILKRAETYERWLLR